MSRGGAQELLFCRRMTVEVLQKFVSRHPYAAWVGSSEIHPTLGIRATNSIHWKNNRTAAIAAIETETGYCYV